MTASEKPLGAVQADADKFAMAMLIASADSEGEIVAGDDGLYVYWPKGWNGGAFSAWVLRGLADELDRRNAPWDAQVQAYFDAQSTPLDELQTLGQQYDQPTTFHRFTHEEEINDWLDTETIIASCKGSA